MQVDFGICGQSYNHSVIKRGVLGWNIVTGLASRSFSPLSEIYFRSKPPVPIPGLL